MKLRYRLFISYLLVVGVGLTIIVIATVLVAPVNFSDQMRMTRGNGYGGGGNAGNGAGMGRMGQQNMSTLDDEIEANFQDSMNRALILSAVVAVAAGALASWLVSQRILIPIRKLVHASHHIANGHYDERLHSTSRDELAELMDSFNQMAAALNETETLRQQLLADVTHELKTPLASIQGYMEGLQDNVVPATAETYQIVHREAARLQRLVEDLQALSRIESGALALELRPADLEPLLMGTAARLAPQFNEKGIALQIDPLDHLPQICVDGDRIAQVFTNLLGNALQYTPPGGAVQVSAYAKHGQMVIDFTDDGAGLAPGDAERIFQRFYRVDKSRSRASGGSGIGLTIARQLATLHGGTLTASSPGLGAGSTFTLTLPLASPRQLYTNFT